MNIKELYTNTLKNNGATITRSGEALSTTEGYLVSRSGYESRLTFLDERLFVSVLCEYQHLINTSVDLAGCVIGFWFNEADQSWYVDVSEHIVDRGIAERLGKHRKQIAIYDVARGESILVK